MSSFQFCPTCFAELYEQSTCGFCGQELSTTATEPFASDSNSLIKISSDFEIAGLPLTFQQWDEIDKGTLFVGRYSLLQFKQRLDEGYCYIAYDHWMGQHTFVTLWKAASSLSQYHKSIQYLSTVYDAGVEPIYSAFTPQEGLPIEQALKRLGWNSGRIWEVFRQVCQCAITAEVNEHLLPIFPPDHVWIRPDGIVEMSVQKMDSMDVSTPMVQQLVSLLGWLYDPSEPLDLLLFPLKVRPVVLRHWEDPISVSHFWDAVNICIHEKGWYRLNATDRAWLLNNHAPNRLQLLDDTITVPSTIQLCIWNGVSGSWRLHEGKVVLQSCLEGLFEVGILDAQDGGESIAVLESLVMQQHVPIQEESLDSVLMHLRYGNRASARNALASWIRKTKHLSDWMNIAKTLFVIGDDVAALDIVQIALPRIDFLREALDVASAIRWWGGDVQLTKHVLRSHRTNLHTVWEYTEWIEGWMALVHSSPPISVQKDLERVVEGLEDRERQEWLDYVSLHFGEMREDVFSKAMLYG